MACHLFFLTKKGCTLYFKIYATNKPFNQAYVAMHNIAGLLDDLQSMKTFQMIICFGAYEWK